MQRSQYRCVQKVVPPSVIVLSFLILSAGIVSCVTFRLSDSLSYKIRLQGDNQVNQHGNACCFHIAQIPCKVRGTPGSAAALYNEVNI